MKASQADRDAPAANLRRLRRHAGLPQQQLAERSFLSPSTIGGLENARAWPETMTALLLCRHGFADSPDVEATLDALLDGRFAGSSCIPARSKNDGRDLEGRES